MSLSMRSKRCVGLAAAVLLVGTVAASAPEPSGDLAVMHAEAPAWSVLAAKTRFAGTVKIRVIIAPTGEVTDTVVEQGQPLGVAELAEAAARKWTFTPSHLSRAREATLSFVFGNTVYSEAPEHLEASFDDPLTMLLRYSLSTIGWLPTVQGEIPEKRCPIHGEVMAVELVPIRYEWCGHIVDGEETPEIRQLREELLAYENARQKLFPASNRWVNGGYGGGAYQDKAQTYYCQLCRDLDDQWLAQHPLVVDHVHRAPSRPTVEEHPD